MVTAVAILWNLPIQTENTISACLPSPIWGFLLQGNKILLQATYSVWCYNTATVFKLSEGNNLFYVCSCMPLHKNCKCSLSETDNFDGQKRIFRHTENIICPEFNYMISKSIKHLALNQRSVSVTALGMSNYMIFFPWNIAHLSGKMYSGVDISYEYFMEYDSCLDIRS